MSTTIDTVFSKELQVLGAQIEEKVLTGFTLADAIRAGSTVTDKATGSWGQNGQACAMTAAALYIKAMQDK